MRRLPAMLVALTLSSVTAMAEKLPVESFASLPYMHTARLSPDGKRLAAWINVKGLSHITVLELGSGGAPESVMSTDNKERRFSWFDWASNERLLVAIRYPDNIYGTDVVETELYSVRYDGEGFLNLMKPGRNAQWVPQIKDRVVDLLPDDPDHILLALDMKKANQMDVYRVNINNARRRRVERGYTRTRDFITDRQHRIRAQVTLSNGRREVRMKDPDGRNVRTLWTFDVLSRDAVSVLGFDQDPDTVYISAYHHGRRAIFKVDLGDPQLQRTLVYSDPEYDVEGTLLYSEKSQRVIGISNRRREDAYFIWDEEYRPLFEGVARALPDTHNLLIDISRDERLYIVLASNSTHPGTFYFGDRETGRLTPFAKRYPDLSPELLTDKTRVRYPAGDGTEVDGYLTLPPDYDDDVEVPAIVLPHGGPAARTNPGFDYWAAFLANRGYAVLEMDFRGSSGRGFQWMASAFANWDRITQQDIKDGVDYLVESGIADPARICIVGGSFGGYAAMIGAVKYSDVYRCAVSFAGVSDLVELRNRSRRFLNSELTEQQIGRITSRLKAASPISHAADVDIPLLLIHGATDRVVAVEHSRDMHDALEAAGKDVEYVELETGDHYLSHHFDRIRTFEIMDEFLSRHLVP